MIAKRVYLFLTGGLLLISMGTGFARQDKHTPSWNVLQSLETAKLQLHLADPYQSAHQTKALELIQQAMIEMKAELAAEHPEHAHSQSSG